MRKDWWNRTLVILILTQAPNAENHFTTVCRKLVSMGKGMEGENKKLWWHKSKSLDLGLFQIIINYESHYF